MKLANIKKLIFNALFGLDRIQNSKKQHIYKFRLGFTGKKQTDSPLPPGLMNM
jgi:hypothetical protein